MSKGWNEERRRKQAERCRKNKPWEHSTGPKTAKGKKRASMNAFKHGMYSRVMDEYRMAMRLMHVFLIQAGQIIEEDEYIRMINERRARRKQAYSRRRRKWMSAFKLKDL